MSVGWRRMKYCHSRHVWALFVIQFILALCLYFASEKTFSCNHADRRRVSPETVQSSSTGPRRSWFSQLAGAICGVNPEDSVTTVYLVTATYYRPTQKADLTRLAQTLMNLDFVFWVVVEDGERTSPAVAELIARSGIPHRYFAAPTPPIYRESIGIGRGVFNRRAALEWLRAEDKEGVLYFADDDNTYDLRIFREMQKTQQVSVFPVGMVLEFGISSPIVVNHKVVGFHDAFQNGRVFAMDMAGFAVNLALVRSHPHATLPARLSYMEDGFLLSLGMTTKDLEPLASDCTEVLVWHTRTEPALLPDPTRLVPLHNATNLVALYRNILA